MGDLGKAVVAIAAARFICKGDLLAGLAAMVGHNYSVFLGMKGGRGVALGAAVTVLMAPVTLLLGTVVFVTTVALTRYVSLESMLAALSMPPTLLLLVSTHGQAGQHLLFATLSAAFIVFSHRDNLGRLRYGTERKLGRGFRGQPKDGE